MELTLDQALQKGVEAHKAGKAQEADQYYTAILKANPKHPDANHNMGVLAVGVDKVEAALPFFKTALEANSNIAQYWLSYIDALIKLDRIADAKAVFDQATSKGMKGNGFEQIEKQLGSSTSNNSNNQEPSQAELQNLVNLYSKGQVKQVLTEASELLLKFPSSIDLYNIIGAANRGLGKLEAAIKAFNKSLSIKPDNAEAYYNLGVTLKEQGRRDQAIEAYKKAISIKPGLAEVTSNLAILLFESRRFKEAEKLFFMNDSIKEQSYLLKCFYKLDKKVKFYEQLDYLIKRGENNCVIGSYASRAAIRYGTKKYNPFCNDPLKYVKKIDLIKKCDFKTTFIENATNVLSNDEVSHRSQGLLTNGIQTSGNIFTQVGSVTNLWQDVIRAELTNYKNHFCDSTEGLIQEWPSDYSLNGWLLRMKNGGELSAHIHEMGWISGSIYINVPPKSKKDSGNLVVTSHEPEDGKQIAKYTKSIDVVTGSLCLFPSSLLHYTIPFESNEDRIVLAFDMIPN